MNELFVNEFVTWRHKTPVGVKVDEVFGMDSKSGKVWNELARQIFCELDDVNYREIRHFDSGAPYIDKSMSRISITHTDHLFIGAFLPKTPDCNLEVFNPRTAMGIDAERLDRKQVIKIRERFLSDKELSMIDEDDITANIIAWTSKEALYKAALTPGLDFRDNIQIEKLQQIDFNPGKRDLIEKGTATLILEGNTDYPEFEMELYSYESYGCCVTIAVSPKAAKFQKK